MFSIFNTQPAPNQLPLSELVDIFFSPIKDLEKDFEAVEPVTLKLQKEMPPASFNDKDFVEYEEGEEEDCVTCKPKIVPFNQLLLSMYSNNGGKNLIDQLVIQNTWTQEERDFMKKVYNPKFHNERYFGNATSCVSFTEALLKEQGINPRIDATFTVHEAIKNGNCRTALFDIADLYGNKTKSRLQIALISNAIARMYPQMEVDLILALAEETHSRGYYRVDEYDGHYEYEYAHQDDTLFLRVKPHESNTILASVVSAHVSDNSSKYWHALNKVSKIKIKNIAILVYVPFSNEIKRSVPDTAHLKNKINDDVDIVNDWVDFPGGTVYREGNKQKSSVINFFDSKDEEYSLRDKRKNKEDSNKTSKRKEPATDNEHVPVEIISIKDKDASETEVKTKSPRGIFGRTRSTTKNKETHKDKK